MIDYESLATGATGTAVSAAGFALSVTQIQAIFSLAATGLGLLITITTSIVIPIAKKIIKARKDGKITTDEAQEILEEVEKGCENVKKELDKADKNMKGKKNE